MSEPVQAAPARLGRVELVELAQLTSGQAWTLPILLSLGVLSSFAESLGISLVVLFLYAAMGRLEDAAAAGGAIGSLFAYLAAYLPSAGLIAPFIIVAITLKSLLATAYTMIASWVQNKIGQDIRDRLHRRYLEIEYHYIRRMEEGEMVQVLASDSWAVSDAYHKASRILISGVTAFVMILFLLLISWVVTLFAILGAATLFIGLNLLVRLVRRLGQERITTNQELVARMLHTLQGMRSIRVFGQERQYQKAFERTSSEARRIATKTELVYALNHPASEIGHLLLLTGIVMGGTSLSIPFPVILACVAILYRLQGPLRELQGYVLGFAELTAPLRSVAKVLRHANKSSDSTGYKPFSRLNDAIEFRAVDFRYGLSGDKALDKVSFHIPAGRVTALVGASGAGKTTLVNLLLRLDEPSAGQITIDGEPLSNIRRSDWVQGVALAGQDVELIEATVAANIRLARPEADEKALREAAELAGLLDVIDNLPKRLNEWIGPQGANLSGGQRQRLGIARAILRDPQVLILDEATSALDAKMESTIRDNLRSRLSRRTILIITHRLSTIVSADHVVCVEAGRILEEGCPAKLLERPGSAFRRMFYGASQPTCSEKIEPSLAEIRDLQSVSTV